MIYTMSTYESDNVSDYDEEMVMPTCHIRTYQFEPLSPNSLMPETEADTEENREPNRIGILGWCVCEHCKVMETNEESPCCREEVPAAYFGVGVHYPK